VFDGTSVQWEGAGVGGADIGVAVCILLAYGQPDCSSEVGRRKQKYALFMGKDKSMEGVCLACSVCAGCSLPCGFKVGGNDSSQESRAM
jgi:hypothetical protein